MSDALLTRIAEGIDALRADIKKLGGASAGATTPPKTTAGATGGPAAGGAGKGATATKAADKPAAANKAADKPAGPAAGTKAPGGKRTVEQVREMIRKVAADVDKQSAKDILMDDGGGVEKVGDLKPENYDAVFEACEILLKGEGKGTAAAADDDLM